jgi:class 3 adenylate cyclase
MVFIACAAFCILNLSTLKKKPFQSTLAFSGAAAAKYEKDGNLYVIDSSSFRLICMIPDGQILYTINIDKMKEFTRIIETTIDEEGNLYVYAMEAEYDAYLTKRDIIKKYDKNGNFVKDILSISYDNIEDNPHTFYQFGSLRCVDGILTFSRIQRDRVILYRYDTFRDDLDYSVFSGEAGDFSVARLVAHDSQNFAYVTRAGDIFEVKNGLPPMLRASFNWTEASGGVIPWYIDYDKEGNLVFFDMVSGTIFRITGDNHVQNAVPPEFFITLKNQGVRTELKGFGLWGNNFAGVYGDVVWFYDGVSFRTYEDDLRLPMNERLYIMTVQILFVVGIIAFIAGLCILFIGILDRYVSLFIKQTVVIIPILIAAFTILFSVTFKIMIERLNNELFNEMQSISMLSARFINGDDLEQLKSLKDSRSESYANLSRAVKEITGNNRDPWNKGYYAALYIGAHFEHCVLLSNDEINLFRPASALEGEDYDLFMSGKPIGGIFSSNDGEWAYSAAPVYNSRGEIAGMFELGLDMTSHQISNTKLKKGAALIAAVICIVILFALSIIISIVVKQLAFVAEVLRDIANGNHRARVRYKARDELGRVSRGLNTMAQELQEQFERITRLNESTIRFVPIQFMEHLGVSDITRMKLGDNVQRDLTVLFFDIRAFSINSEMMTARENFLFINKVLGIAGPVIRNHNGFVDKYIGDAAMALFVSGQDAIRAGIELYRKLVLDKQTRIKIGVDGINIGVGIHSGSVMMGIVGENERLSSTVISPNVNLASRIESLTKQTKSGMLITRDTLNQISGSEDEFSYRFIGMVQAAGVNEVIGVFDVLDALPSGVRQKRISTKHIFESGVRKYHTKDYKAAYKRFSQVAAADPQDVCAANYLEETKKRLEDPGLPSVFIFDKK